MITDATNLKMAAEAPYASVVKWEHWLKTVGVPGVANSPRGGRGRTHGSRSPSPASRGKRKRLPPQ
jgi:hypothetical protein